MGALASYLIFCDPAPAQLGLQTEVELLHVNSKSLNANSSRIADKPYIFLNKQGVDIGSLTTEFINVDADIVLEGNANRGFRLYICIEGVPCVGVGDDPLQAVVHDGRALVKGAVRLGGEDRDCSHYLDAMLKREEEKLDTNAPASLKALAVEPAKATDQLPTASKPGSPSNRSEKARTAAIIKKILSA